MIADSALQLYYDKETGKVVEDVEGLVRTISDVRAGLVEEATREAVIAELENQGYFVFGPYL